jgi:hypothetical protein
MVQIGLLAENPRGTPAAQVGEVYVDDVVLGLGVASEDTELPGDVLVSYAVHTFPGHGMTLGFGPGEDTAWFHPGEQALLGQPRTLVLEVEVRDASVRPVLHCASHFQHFERVLDPVPPSGTGTVRVSVPVPPADWRYYGGQNDGNLHGPIRLVRIGARPAATGDAGRLVVRRVWCETAAAAGESVVVYPLHGQRDGVPTTDGVLQALSIVPVKGVLRLEYRDEWEQGLGERELGLTLPAGGHPVRLPLPAPPAAAGACTEVLLTFLSETGEPLSSTVSTALCAPWEGEGSRELTPESPWGMGAYLYRYPDTEDGLARMERAAALARAAGVKWSREEILWSRTEPVQGRFDFSFYDKVVDCAHRNGISVYGLLTYWSQWTEPYTEQGIEDYCTWVRQVVRHYRDRIRHWEVWNEPNIFFWSGPKELYIEALKRAYAVIKEEDPGAVVLGCSTAGIDLGFIRQCLEAEAPFDILTVHPYRARLDDAAFMDELRATGELVDGREVWITEMGWPTQVGGPTSEMEQARLLARCYLSAVASGAAPNVSWYNFREDGTVPFYNEHHFGSLRYDLTPKPAYRALATLCTTLGPVRDGEAVPAPEGVHAFSFARDRDRVTTAVWAPEWAGTLLARGRAIAGVEVLSYVGGAVVTEGASDLCLVPVRLGAPVYLKGQVQELTQPLVVTVDQAAVHPGESIDARVRVRNPGPDAWSGPLVLSLPDGWTAAAPQLSCAAGDVTEVEFRVTLSASVETGMASVPVCLDTPIGRVCAALRVEIVPRVLRQ